MRRILLLMLDSDGRKPGGHGNVPLSHHCTRECSSVFTSDAPTVKFCSNAEVSNNNLYYRDDFASVGLSLFLFPAVPRKQYSS